jgi:RNA polymerase sigma factor (TIGR02999 family)
MADDPGDDSAPREPRAGEITELLRAGAAGDAERLWRLVYPELRKRAAALCRGERPDHTLGATAVVNETYVRLATRAASDWEDRSHFYKAASAIMRHVLIDHARARVADKRGGGARRETLDEELFPTLSNDAAGFDAARQALEHLAHHSERAALVVALHVFGGLGFREIADELGVSERTAKNDWQLGRTQLARALGH